MSDDKQLHGLYRLFPVQGEPSCLTGMEPGEPLTIAPPNRAQNQVWDVRPIEENMYHIVLKEDAHLGASAFPDVRPFGAVRLLDRLSAFRISTSDGAEGFVVTPAETDHLMMGSSPGRNEVVLLPRGSLPFLWRFVRA